MLDGVLASTSLGPHDQTSRGERSAGKPDSRRKYRVVHVSNIVHTNQSLDLWDLANSILLSSQRDPEPERQHLFHRLRPADDGGGCNATAKLARSRNRLQANSCTCGIADLLREAQNGIGIRRREEECVA